MFLVVCFAAQTSLAVDALGSAPAATKSDAAPSVPSAVDQRVEERVDAIIDAKKCVTPTYPREALFARETGFVALKFLVDVDGVAIESKVAMSSGFPRLDEAARSALALCKFVPGTANGQAVKSWAQINYLWKIDNAKAVLVASTCVMPHYPEASVRNQETGLVVTKFLIDINGIVKENVVERSSGFPLLDEAASTALSKCKFKPELKGGQPIESWTRIEYMWELK